MKTTLYEISDVYKDFISAVENGEIEDPQAIADTLDGIQQEFDAKVENIACLYKSMSAEAEAIETEAKALAARAKYKRNVCERMRQYVASNMLAVGQAKYESPRARLSFRKSESLEITDEGKLAASLSIAGADDLLTVETVRKFDKAGIKKAVKEGAVLYGCEIITNQNLQIR